MMGQAPQISEAEFEVMKVIWDDHPVSTNEVVERLREKQDWSPKTIQTMLIRLEKKGAITHQKEGRVYVYSPLVEKERYLAEESHSFLERFYEGALGQMVASFVEQDMLSAEGVAQLKAILDQAGQAKG